MGSKSTQVQETPQQRALADVGKAQLADFKQRWQPVQMKFASDIAKTGAADSYARRHATAQAGIDTSQRFGLAADKLDSTAAASGQFGGARQKLGITGMADDRSTSAGLGAVAADQAVDNQYVTGLGAVTALGRGEKASAISGMGQSAQISAAQAQADAQQSLQNRIGNYQLAGTVAGMGMGLMSGSKPQTTPDLNIDPYGEGIVPGDSPFSDTGANIRGRH